MLSALGDRFHTGPILSSAAFQRLQEEATATRTQQQQQQQQQPPQQQQQRRRVEEENEKTEQKDTNKSDKTSSEEGQKQGPGPVGSERSGSGAVSPFELLASDPLVDRAVFDRVNDMLQEMHTLRHGVVPSSRGGDNNNIASSVLSSAPLSSRLLAQSLSLATTTAIAAHITTQVTPCHYHSPHVYTL